VTGSQHWRGATKPNCRVVGGWFDFQQGTLSLLLQGAEHLDSKWRAQVQQFRINRQTKQVTLEYMLYGYGLSNENTAIQVHHHLDVLDRTENLAANGSWRSAFLCTPRPPRHKPFAELGGVRLHTPLNIFATYIVDFGLIIALYGYKALLFRFVRASGLLISYFFLGVALLVPITWLTSPDWNNDFVCRIAIWVGDPIGILAIPCASFLFDYFKGWRDMRYWPIRVPIEIFVAAPLWLIIWAFIQFFVLGWVWI
jgi:hypothetical protein